MGFWDWLWKPSAPKVQTADLIWLTESAMLQGLIQQIQQLQAAEYRVLVTAHFPDELGGAIEQFQLAGIAFRPWHPPRELETAVRELGQAERDVLIADARLLPRLSREMDSFQPHRSHLPLVLIVCHHHPLRTEDEWILNFASSLPATAVMFLTSLDQPLFQRFAGHNIQQLLRTLGIQEEEVIESSMVDRQVVRAQQRIARAVPDPRPADSVDEWFERNLPFRP